MKPDDALTEQQMLRVFYAATTVVLVVVLVGFFSFLAWSKRDRAKRNAQVRKATGTGLDD